jgi:hypothetical protein
VFAEKLPSPQSIIPVYVPVGEYGNEIGEDAVQIEINGNIGEVVDDGVIVGVNEVVGVDVGVGNGVIVFVGVIVGVGVDVGVGVMSGVVYCHKCCNL